MGHNDKHQENNGEKPPGCFKRFVGKVKEIQESSPLLTSIQSIFYCIALIFFLSDKPAVKYCVNSCTSNDEKNNNSQLDYVVGWATLFAIIASVLQAFVTVLSVVSIRTKKSSPACALLTLLIVLIISVGTIGASVWIQIIMNPTRIANIMYCGGSQMAEVSGIKTQQFFLGMVVSSSIGTFKKTITALLRTFRVCRGLPEVEEPKPIKDRGCWDHVKGALTESPFIDSILLAIISAAAIAWSLLYSWSGLTCNPANPMVSMCNVASVNSKLDPLRYYGAAIVLFSIIVCLLAVPLYIVRVKSPRSWKSFLWVAPLVLAIMGLAVYITQTYSKDNIESMIKGNCGQSIMVRVEGTSEMTFMMGIAFSFAVNIFVKFFSMLWESRKDFIAREAAKVTQVEMKVMP